jgi:hypothetical protein
MILILAVSLVLASAQIDAPDYGFPISGDYYVLPANTTAGGIPQLLANTKLSLAITGDSLPGMFNIKGKWESNRPGFSGSGSNSGLKWAHFGGVYGHPGSAVCPGEPAGTECGYEIGCPIPPGHQWPVSCLVPSASHGCNLPPANATAGGIPQCQWPDVATAQKYCGEWVECLGLMCTYTKPFGGTGGGTVCLARGNGTKISGGTSGDIVEFAYYKTGNATGSMSFPDGKPSKVEFVFEFEKGTLTFKDTGEIWQHNPNPVAPMPLCAKEGCTKYDPGKR